MAMACSAHAGPRSKVTHSSHGTASSTVDACMTSKVAVGVTGHGAGRVAEAPAEVVADTHACT